MKRFTLAVVVSLALALALSAPALAQVVITGPSQPGNQVGVNNEKEIGSNAQAGAAASAGASAVSSPTQVNAPTTVQTNTQLNTQVNHQGQHQGQGQAQGQKQRTNVNVSVEGDRTEIPAQAPAIFSPNLTSSPEACMGSISGGGGAGFNGISFGFNLGSTWTNEECQDRMNARTIAANGDAQAAREYLAAANPKIAAAYKRAGVKVAVNEEKERVAAAPVVEQGGAVKEKRESAVQNAGPRVIHEALVRTLADRPADVQAN